MKGRGAARVSPRILAAIEALPLASGLRVLEIGWGPGVAAREIVRRWPDAHVLGIDRSAAAVRQAVPGGRFLTDGGHPLREVRAVLGRRCGP